MKENNTSMKEATCLCGAISFMAYKVNNYFEVCHCDMCRKWGGGPLFAVACGSDVEFDDKENISVYDSSPWAERAFCKKCGTHLYYRLKDEDRYIVPVGAFNNIEDPLFKKQVFIDQKPEYYCFANETENLTGREVFEHYYHIEEGEH